MSIDRFRTARLTAERLAARHLPELAAMHADPRMMATLGGVRSREATKEYLSANLRHWDRYGFGLWVFYDEAGTAAGRGGIRHAIVQDVDEIEIAYALTPKFWGQGLATEIARESVGIADALGIAELVAFTLATNMASLAVMRKAGFRFDKEIMHSQDPHALYRRRPEQAAVAAG
jgi:RimJ/RimL family protein N-acetyltransferase